MKCELPLPESLQHSCLGGDLVIPLILVRMPCAHAACCSLPKAEARTVCKIQQSAARAGGALLIACYCPCVRRTSLVLKGHNMHVMAHDLTGPCCSSNFELSASPELCTGRAPACRHSLAAGCAARLVCSTVSSTKIDMMSPSVASASSSSVVLTY